MSFRSQMWKWTPWLCVAVVFAVAGWAGLEIRWWTYEHSTSFRHVEDITNNFEYGRRAVKEGLLDLYGNVQKENPAGEYTLDYVPLRLLVMRQWAAWGMNKYGPETPWRADYEFTRPLLMVYSTSEAVSAIAMFFLVRLWVRRSVEPIDQTPLTGMIPAVIAALLVWFNPAAWLSAYAWPSSDVWIVTFFLLAILLASLDWWLVSGIALGVGVMFKGQQLVVAPLFILWPLFMWKPKAMLRWMAGFALAAGVIASPWLLRDDGTPLYSKATIGWLACVVIACGMMFYRATREAMSGRMKMVFDIVAAALIIWPWCLQRNLAMWWAGVAIAAAFVSVARYVSPRRQLYLAAGMIGLSLALLPILFHTDLSWFDVSFRYGSRKYPQLAQWCANNLPALLEMRFGWQSLEDEVTTIGGHVVTLKQTLTAVYGVGLVLCSAAMARHTVHRDRRFLVAFAAPWLIAFCFLPQMNARYLLLGASVAAAGAGVGFGMILTDLFLIFASWMMIAHLLTNRMNDPFPSRLHEYLPLKWADPVQNFYMNSHPGMAWAIIVATLTVTFVGLTRSSRKRATFFGVPQAARPPVSATDERAQTDKPPVAHGTLGVTV